MLGILFLIFASCEPLKNFLCLFSSILVITKTFRGNRLLKYLINLELIWLSATKYKPNFHMAWHGMLFSIVLPLMCQTKDSNKRAPGRVVIYISVHLVLIYTLALTGGNWQKWKRVFLTCPCHEIYRDEAVGLKGCKNTWKIMIFVKMWNLGNIVKI